MKKIITTLFIVLGVYSLVSAQAQVKERGDTEFGIEVGLNGSDITTGDGWDNTDFLTGLNAGVSGDLYFSDKWSLKVKVLYEQKGAGNGLQFQDDQGNNYYGYNFKASYITIPVLANWHFGRTRNWYFDFGPYVGILTSASYGGQDLKYLTNSTDIGFRADVGIKLPISQTSNFFIETGVQGGFSNVFNDGSDLQNETSSLNVGISF